MNLVVFEDYGYLNLLPLTWFRPAVALRCGRDTLLDKMRVNLPGRIVGTLFRPELRGTRDAIFQLEKPVDPAHYCLINARALIGGTVRLPPLGSAWAARGAIIAATLPASAVVELEAELFLDERRARDWLEALQLESTPDSVRLIDHPWDLIVANGPELRRQCEKRSGIIGKVYPGAHLVNEGDICIAAGARVKPGAVLDAENGPIVIDAGALIEPAAVLQGPCYIGPQSIIRPGAVIRENTSIGPVCKVGGEVEGSIFQGYANKQHDGFLGHSFIAPWANLGADTVTSDLKNTYGTIRVHLNGVGVESGQRFIGSTIGDHAKTGIGTILPTGCVLGACSNVFTQGAVPKFVPSFGWLTDRGLEAMRVDKAVSIARTVMARRNIDLSPADEELFRKTAELARVIETMGWSDGAEREVFSST